MRELDELQLGIMCILMVHWRITVVIVLGLTFLAGAWIF